MREILWPLSNPFICLCLTINDLKAFAKHWHIMLGCKSQSEAMGSIVSPGPLLPAFYRFSPLTISDDKIKFGHGIQGDLRNPNRLDYADRLVLPIFDNRECP